MLQYIECSYKKKYYNNELINRLLNCGHLATKTNHWDENEESKDESIFLSAREKIWKNVNMCSVTLIEQETGCKT